MTGSRAALDAALARHEHHGRPGLPLGGFRLGRADGSARPGIHRTDGSTLIEPDGILQRILPSPDRRRIAVEWAQDADENGVLGIVDVATAELTVHRDIRLRHDTMLWDARSRTLDVVATRDRRLVTLDASTGARRAVDLPPGERVRLFPGGRRGRIAHSSGEGTTLTDRATGATLGRWPALHRALALPGGALIWHAGGLDAVDRHGAALWRWDDPLVGIVDVAADGDRVVVLGVADGRSVLLELRDGAEQHRTNAGAAALSTTSIGVDDGILRLAVEGPLSPPRIVEGLPPTMPESPTGRTVRHEFRADDGATLVVHVTAPHGAAGPIPLILTCYGGFGVPHLPLYEPTVPAWVEQGGAFASAQLRGGGEHGRAWREAGRGAGKERTVADLAAVARGLVDLGITRPDLLVLAGSSLGGVVAAGCGLQHPGLCAGIATTAAPLDLLALAAHPLGALWRPEFGDDGTAEAHDRLRRLSPLARAEALPAGAEPPAFLGIVLGEDTRVRADDTERMVSALRRAGGEATLWRASAAGHGANAQTALHELGLAVLDFAAELTMRSTS